MRKRGRLFHSLVKSYLFFALTLGIIYLFVQLFSGGFSSKYFDDPVDASLIVKADYTSIDSKAIEESGGWVEILDNQRALIYIIGNKRDKRTQYSTEEMMSMMYSGQKGSYLYSIAPFRSNQGASLICLVVIPREMGHSELKLLQPPNSVSITLTSSFYGILLLSVLSAYIYSRWTSSRLTIPLEQISAAIKHMKEGNYDQRLAFRSNEELTTIQECFNEMAEHLQDTEQANQTLKMSKQRMLLDISHDLKTPITTIQGYASALLLGLADNEEKRIKYLNLIHTKAKLMTELIEDLFELSKLDTPDYPWTGEFQYTDLGELVREIAAENYDQFEQKHFNLSLSIPAEEISIRLHPTMMSRAVSNLLVNALKYNPAGTSVDIELTQMRDTISLKISDDGIGIPESIRDTLFDPFVRGNAARTSDGGTGLGLSIAKKAVELHGGELHLLSAAGRTTFEIKLYNQQAETL
ncbi:HAMP domain-containing sensor histidine kinase [Paenibacillus sp. YPG26]|uniref:HAMP domain-containing sensor histidine kinase n=1 Tax=Paenibacillus sp. YPG26 TaxID=2878915 RepID=UPI00203F35AA|nr:HAMP domain-containing sensor histidine kinase [Paenibacillus sp. YPG26]USB34648.1 HAMP domain-containing histidine kinase [Paenibacillus sp. YPG26]